MLKTVLAAAAVAAVGLIAAPAAQATWMTGNTLPVLFDSSKVCTDGMDFQYASPGPLLHKWPGAPRPTVSIDSLVVVERDANGRNVYPLLVDPADHTVPYSPLWIDPAPLPNFQWPDPNYPGVLTYSTRFTLHFTRPVQPGTYVMLNWMQPFIGEGTTWGFLVTDCRLLDRPAPRPVFPAPPWW